MSNYRARIWDHRKNKSLDPKFLLLHHYLDSYQQWVAVIIEQQVREKNDFPWPEERLLGWSNLHTPSLRVAARHYEALERCGLTNKTRSKLATNHFSHQVSVSISFFHKEGKLQLGQFLRRKPLATLPLAFYFKLFSQLWMLLLSTRHVIVRWRLALIMTFCVA